jgi:hypothetical protein
MDHIDNHLATAAINHMYSPAIRAALALGKRTLNRYYDWTDHSEIYRIAMSAYLFSPPQSIYILAISSASTSQVGVLQKGGMGGGMD